MTVNNDSEPVHLTQRSQIDAEFFLSLHFVNVGSWRRSLRELQSIIHTSIIQMKRGVGRLRLREQTFPLAKWTHTPPMIDQSDARSSEKSHPPFLISETRLVSEAGISNGEHFQFFSR